MTSRSLIWFVPKFPFPADDGAKQAHVQLLREVAALGVRIHLCTFAEPGDSPDVRRAKDEAGVENVTVIRREKRGPRAHAVNLARSPLSPLTVMQFGTPDIARQVAAVLSANPASTVVYDGLHCAGWQLSAPSPLPSRPSVYRAHNVERDIWLRAATDARNPLKKLFLRAQATLLQRFERRVVQESRVVFPVSETDATVLRDLAPAATLVTLPIGIRSPAGAALQPPPSRRDLLFVGRLDWPPNRDGLKWLLESVWPAAHARSPDLRLDIVGSGDGAWLEAFRSLPGVRFHGRVDSVVPFYQSAAASLVPVFYGSGTRVKAIESSLLGRVCISTAVGVEGIGLTPGLNYIRAETDAEWIDALATFEPARAAEMGAAAATLVKEAFDPVRIAARFVGALTDRFLL